MRVYTVLKRVNNFEASIQIKKLFPDLDLSLEEIEDRLEDLTFEFFEDNKPKTTLLFRLSLIPAVLLMTLLFLFSPAKFIITGRWDYKFLWLSNWFKKLGF